MGRKVYWFTVVPIEEAEPGTDRRAVEDGYVSIMPLRIDLTDEERLRQAKDRYPLEEVPGSKFQVPSRGSV